MKKIISLLIAVTILASMCIMAVPASAEEGRLEIPSKVVVDKDGNWSMDVKVWGDTAWDSWIAIYRKDMVAMCDKSSDGMPLFDDAGHFGRLFLQPSKGNVATSTLNKNYSYKDGTTITFSNKTMNYSNHPMVVGGEYTMYCFRHFSDVDVYEIVAQKDFVVECGWDIFVKSGMRHSRINDPMGTEEMIWLNKANSSHTTTFTAKGEFDALGFTAWSDKHNDQKWGFSIYDTMLSEDTEGNEVLDVGENLLFDTQLIIKEGEFNLLKFDSPLPAGDYAFKVYALDDYVETEVETEKRYLVMPVSEILPDSTVWTEYDFLENCDGNGILCIQEETSAVGFGIHLTGKGIVENTPAGDATEAPVDETEAPADETEAPADETEAPADETEAPEETTPPEETTASDTTEAPKATADASAKDDAKKDGGLSVGAIVGIVVGGVVVLAGVGVAVYFLVIKKKK